MKAAIKYAGLPIALIGLIGHAGAADDAGSPDIKAARHAFETTTGDERVEAASKLLAADPDSAGEVIGFLFEQFKDQKVGGSRFVDALRPAPEHAVPVLIEVLDDESSLRFFARYALVHYFNTSRPALEQKLKSESPRIRRSAVETIGDAYANGAVSAGAVKALLDDEDAGVRYAAAITFLQIQPPSADDAVAALASMYPHLESADRRRSLDTISRFTPRATALPVLELALRDESLGNRFSAAAMLAGENLVDDETLIKVFHEALASPRMSNEDSAAHYLGRYGPAASAALPDLRSTLDSDNPEKRQAAALAVALIDPKQVDAMLPHLLADMSEKTGYSRHRLKVIQGLGRIGPAAKAAAPGLRELLNREREPLTVSIAVALLKIAPDDTDAAYTSLRRYFAGEVTSYVPAKEFAGFGEQGLPLLDDLIRVIETPESRHSYQAVNLLAAIGPGASRAAPALEARLQQEKYDSQKEAIQAALRAILAEKSEGN